MNLTDAARHFASNLNPVTEDAVLEARLIIQKVTGLSRPVLLSHPERLLSESEITAIQSLVEQRIRGIPLPYLLGEWEFFGHPFFVNPSVLIPRPETELLVEQASSWLMKHPAICRGFDIGTGSGCIAISLLLAHPELQMYAVDIRRDTLRTAVSNAVRHGCRERFHPVQADIFSALKCEAHLICANLPYIPTKTCSLIEPARFEPMTALDGGADGFELYRLLFEQITDKIRGDYLIACEIEYRQREQALKTAETFFPESQILVLEDLAGQPRLLLIQNTE